MLLCNEELEDISEHSGFDLNVRTIAAAALDMANVLVQIHKSAVAVVKLKFNEGK
jgi:hypothetical protein